ncbi:hypothetical protein ACIOJE_27905 [Kitasatospora sp. NPDC087861]|uniref:hypothetical protein n=1 Tax=Kitasatospora sp. NPDC087861 TaxID=3364070 RepID=UPI0037FA25B9
MRLFRRRKEPQQPRDIAEDAVAPFDRRFENVVAAAGKERNLLIAESALWQLAEHVLDEGETRWVTCGGVWVPPDTPPLPVRYFLTDRRMFVILDGPNAPTGHVDFPFDDIAVFEPGDFVDGRPQRIQYLVITSESGRPEDGIRSVIEFNLDEPGLSFIGTATVALRDHGGLHARLRRRNAGDNPPA